MKFLRHILLAVLAFSFLVTSCVDPLELSSYRPSVLQDYALAFSPSVLGATLVTKADGDETTDPDPLGENTINTLDIYVYKQSGTAWVFFKRYNLQSTAEKPITSLQDIVLEPDWRNATPNYEAGVNYRTYVIANSRQPENVRKSDLSEANLLALKFPVSDTDPTHIECDYDIVRLKGSAPTDESDLHIANKDFVMDGVVESWRLVNSSEPQYITKYTSNTGDDSGKYHQFELNRAAAKFDLELTFGDFINSVPDPDDPTNKRVITKIWYPSFKFSRFMTATYDIARPTSWRDFQDNLWDSDTRFNFTSQEEIANTDPKRYTYKLTTYSYAYSWASPTEGAEVAPSLTFSVGYSTCKQEKIEGVWKDVDGTDSGPEYHYYRIPFIDLSSFGDDEVQGIKRNHHYSVKATILSKGATPTDPDDPASVSLKYKVIPWLGVKDEEVVDVEATELLYFTADTEYILRGELNTFCRLYYFTPAGDATHNYVPVIVDKARYANVSSSGHAGDWNWGPTDQIPSTATRVDQNGVIVYYVVAPGDTVFISSSQTHKVDSRHYGQTGDDVIIGVNSTGTHGDGGYVQVSSDALANRAVKYIEFDASVTFQVPDYNSEGIITGYHAETVVHHYVIKHFPLDNIQSVLGKWSSRTDDATYTASSYEYHAGANNGRFSYNWTPTDSWERETGRYGNGNDYWHYSPNGVYYTQSDPDGWTLYSSNSNFSGSFDRGWWNSPRYYVWYRWKRTLGDSYSWVRWEENSDTYKVSILEEFRAKVYVDGYIYAIADEDLSDADLTTKYYSAYTNSTDIFFTRNGLWNYHSARRYLNDNNRIAFDGVTSQNFGVSGNPGWSEWDYGNNTYWSTYPGAEVSVVKKPVKGFLVNHTIDQALTNNHMYVVQISKAGMGSDNQPDVILGRPRLDINMQSGDNVVSPAFMIASQLGAVSTFGESDGMGGEHSVKAAKHCATYMEVGENGRRYVGWRLPTAAEIKYIDNYQRDEAVVNQGVFEYVLTGGHYHTLGGGNQTTRFNELDVNDPDYSDSYAVRCIRDLTPEEVKELNETGIINNAPNPGN